MNSNHKVECLNTDCIGGRIETTMTGDSGYSNWTVMDSGFVEFKCHGCGKFASSDCEKEKFNSNQPENFRVTCLKCGSNNWTENHQDVDCEEESTNIECGNIKCKAQTF